MPVLVWGRDERIEIECFGGESTDDLFRAAKQRESKKLTVIRPVLGAEELW